MAMDFPSSPSVGQFFQPSGGPLYQWNGSAWVTATTSPSLTGPTGPSGSGGAVGPTGSTGPTGPGTASTYVLKAGDTMTGDLAFAKSSPKITLNNTIAGNWDIITQRNGTDRWDIGAGTAETGSNNVGTDFGIWGATDAGAYRSSPDLKITRANGNVEFPNNSTFKATRSADQTGIVPSSFTKVQFNTAGINVGSHFNTTNNRWTPPAGRVLLGATLYAGAGAAGVNINACIYKNGALLNYAVMNTGSVTISNVDVETIDVANGTDYYECYFLHNGASNATIYAGSQTWFWGMRL